MAIFVLVGATRPWIFVDLPIGHFLRLFYRALDYMIGQKYVRTILFLSIEGLPFVPAKTDEAMDDDSVAEVTGNKRRRLWKKSCIAAALDVREKGELN
jgi:hypothetical protein